ncbi:MAG: hypothetical protein WAV09_01465 [Minisyncoccia bacterium]
MLHIIITVENDGKEIVEIERELDLDFTKDYQEPCVIVHPKDADGLVVKACNDAQDYLNSHPELWPEPTEDNDPQDD